MSYEIKQRTKQTAKSIGVIVKPSTIAKYKIDVFDKSGDLLARVGDSNYLDFPSYLEMERKKEVPTGFADKRRQAYWTRHAKEIEKLGDNWIGSRSYYAFMLLWF